MSYRLCLLTSFRVVSNVDHRFSTSQTFTCLAEPWTGLLETSLLPQSAFREIQALLLFRSKFAPLVFIP
jgi:hypothetical protein